jgi:tetratricopeptide (TPR) repeat protein
MDERLKQLLVLGREHYERREFERAERLLSQVLAGGADFADVRNMMGVIAHERGDFVAATEHFERAVDLNPAYTEALLNLVIGYNDIGQYERARQTFARVRTVEPASGERALDDFALGKIANMHSDLATAYADAGSLPDALRELVRAVSLRPGFADLRVKLAGVYKEMGQLGDARRELESACASHPSYTQAHVQLGIVLLALGENGAAAESFRALLVREPNHRTAKVYLRLAEQRDEPARASQAPRPFPIDDDPTHMP